MRNVFIPKQLETLNVIFLYSSFSSKNTKFPNIKNKNGKYLIQNHNNILKTRFQNEKKLNIINIYGNNEYDIIENIPDETTTIINENYKNVGDARSLALGLYNCHTNNCLVVDGRYEWSNNILDCIMTYDFKNPFLLLGEKFDNQIGSIVNNNQPELLMFNSPNKYSGISFFIGKSFEYLKNTVYNKDNINLLTFEIINNIIQKDKTWNAIVNNEEWTKSCL